MPIQVKLFGDLREKARQQGYDMRALNMINLENDGIETIFDILKKFLIKESEVSHIFVNGKYCRPGKKVRDGDRVGLFPQNMGLIFLEIVKNNSIYIKIKLFADLQKYGPAQSVIDLPEGSTLKLVLEKYKIPQEKMKLIILVNGRPCYEKDFVLRNGDVIAIFPPIGGG